MKLPYLKYLLIALLFLSSRCFASPLLLIENNGQITDQYRNVRTDIDLSVAGNGLTLFIGTGQLHYQFVKSERNKADSSYATNMYRLDVELVGANKAALLAKEEQTYFFERYYTDLFGVEGGVAHSYTRAVYKDIYPGIDWVIYVKDDKLKHEFVVKRGADPSQIKLRYSGATALSIEGDGSFRAVTPFGDVVEASPYSYDEKNSKVSSSYVLKGNDLSFEVASYSGALTIDPAIAWSTYYGNAGVDVGSGLDHDLAGNIYMVGYTTSTATIATTGSHQFMMGGGFQDGYIAKFNQSGQRIWATYYGGANGDAVNDVVVDNNNNVYVGGSTSSYSAIATPGTHKPSTTTADAFLAKFDTSGQRLWGTYFGGPGTESIVKVSTDNFGAIYATGNTNSAAEIATPGTEQQVFAGGFNDAFLAKFTSSGALTWGTYMGGTGNEYAKGLCLDGTGNIYIGGETNSETGISTPGSHQEVKGLNGGDVYFVKFNSAGTRIWGTYYGGDHNDGETGGLCEYNGNGALYLAGSTRSSENIATPDGIQTSLSYSFEVEAFVAKFDEAGTRIWGTYYGGLGSEQVYAIECDNDGNVFIGGGGFSLDLGGSCSPQQQNAGNGDVVLIKISSLCEAVWATYHGGPNPDVLLDCDYDDNGNLYITGQTMCVNVFGIGNNVYQPAYSGGQNDAFLAKYVDCATPGQPLGVTGPTPVCEGDTVVYYVGAVCNATSYTWSLPQGWGGFSTVDSIVCLVGQPGTISAYATTGCGSSSAQSLVIDVFPTPEPPIYQTGNLLTTDNVYTSYQWGFNGSDIPGATLPYHTMSVGTGFYTLTVTDTNGCTGFTNYLPVSVKDDLLQHAHIYPNPSSNLVYVDGLNDAVDYEICDIVGTVLLKGKLQKKKDVINIAELAKGVYILKIGSRSMKLTKDQIN